MITLTSTIKNEDRILWPNEDIIFTCETRGLILNTVTHVWTSDDYIGDGISLIINNLGDEILNGSRSYAKLTRIHYNYTMVSQLHIRTSASFQTSKVTCTSFYGTSREITFSVLGMSMCYEFVYY